MLKDPKFIEPLDPTLPEEWRRRYEARSTSELAQDVAKLFNWKRTAGPEKDRLQRQILNLQQRYNWAIGLSLFAFMISTITLLFWAYSS
jgi:hypothetical protein